MNIVGLINAGLVDVVDRNIREADAVPADAANARAKTQSDKQNRFIYQPRQRCVKSRTDYVLAFLRNQTYSNKKVWLLAFTCSFSKNGRLFWRGAKSPSGHRSPFVYHERDEKASVRLENAAYRGNPRATVGRRGCLSIAIN